MIHATRPTDTDTYVLTPKPPMQTPKGFQEGYFQRGRKPTCLIMVGLLMIIGACGIFSGIGWTVYQNNQADEDSPAEVEPTATTLIIGGPTFSTASATSEPSPTISPTILRLPTLTPNPDFPTPTFTFIPPTPLPPTNTLRPTRTPIPPTATATLTTTLTPSITVTLTASDTLTIAPSPTDTSTPPTPTPTFTATRIPPSATPLPSATPTEATGRRVRLLYDAHSFYIWNMSDDDLLVSQLVFEAVDSNGEFADYRLEGSRFAQFYRFLEGTKCVAVEITQAPAWLRPSACWDYNAVLSPQRDYETVFWIERAEVAEFRVLWDEVEIARCPLNAGECDIYIP